MNDTAKLEKSGRNTSQNYDYHTHEDITTAIRAAMIIHKVVYFCSIEEEHVSQNGKTCLCRIKVKHTFTDGSGEITFTNWGYGSDYGSGDKSIYKAITGAKKYALTNLFLLVDGIEGKPTDPEFEDKKEVKEGPQQEKFWLGDQVPPPSDEDIPF